MGTAQRILEEVAVGEAINTLLKTDKHLLHKEEKANESPTCTALISLTKNLFYLLRSLAGLVIGLSLCGLQACLGGYMWVTGLLRQGLSLSENICPDASRKI